MNFSNFSIATIISLLSLNSTTVSCEKDIFKAIHNNSLPQVNQAISANASSVNTDDDEQLGWKPLHSIAIKGDFEIARTLLDNGAKIDSCEDDEKMTPLHIAAQHDSSSVVRVLCEHGANIEKRDSLRRTPLHIACLYCASNSVPIILSRMENIRQVDMYGNTALHSIAMSTNGHIDIGIIDALVEKDPTLLNMKNKKGLKAHKCCKNPKISKYIQEKNTFSRKIDSIFSW